MFIRCKRSESFHFNDLTFSLIITISEISQSFFFDSLKASTKLHAFLQCLSFSLNCSCAPSQQLDTRLMHIKSPSRLVYVDPAWMAIVSEQAASKNFMGSEHACGKGRNWGQLEASSASRHNIHDKFRKVFHVVHVADDKTCEPYLCWGVIRKVFFSI